jgi:hypothetical protein
MQIKKKQSHAAHMLNQTGLSALLERLPFEHAHACSSMRNETTTGNVHSSITVENRKYVQMTFVTGNGLGKATKNVWTADSNSAFLRYEYSTPTNSAYIKAM